MSDYKIKKTAFHHFLPWLLLSAWLLAACQMVTPPREKLQATRTAVSPTLGEEDPMLLPAPTPTGDAAAPMPQLTPPPEGPPALTVWVNETSPVHQQHLEQMANAFGAAEGVSVEIRLVAPALLPELVETAVVSDAYELPDLLLHPLAYSAGWAERGILNGEAAAAALSELDAGTFQAEALALAAGTNGDNIVALPSDGAPQLIIYRRDWFEEADLAPPDTFQRMLTAAETTFDPEQLIAGFVIPTESNLVTTHQAFEHMALANGCHLVDEVGEVQLLSEPCRQALNFYYTIVHNYSPIGVQTETSTRNAYLEGRAGLVIAGPDLLPLLAGLNEAAPPTCPECEADPAFLAANSGVLTTLAGPQGTPTAFSAMTMLGITSAADPETAVAFARYWFNEGYESWFSIEPERKIPLRQGTISNPTQFIEAWENASLAGGRQTLADLYGEDLVTQMQESAATTERWGIPRGYGSLVTTLYEELTFSVVLQEMLSGYFDTEKTLFEAYNRVIDLIPNYPYDRVELTPTATP